MDKKYRAVVAGCDLSDNSEEAVRVALSAASAAERGSLHLVHVIPVSVVASEYGDAFAMDASFAAAKEQVTALARRLDVPANVAVSIRIVVGRPHDVLVEIANDVEADLIVVGTHGRRGVKRVLLGSVAEQVVRTAPCSVLTVRPDRATAA
jgi:nucleotide-binding universal stress UspA family protein